QVEALVDVFKRQEMRDHRIDFDLAVHVPVNDTRHIGASACATEGRALPDAAGHKLERTGRDLLAGTCDADDNRLAPAAMSRLERLTHDGYVAGAIERRVGTADRVSATLGQIDQVRHQIAANLLRVDEVRHAEALAPLLLGVIEIDADDHVSARKTQTLDHVEADAAEAKNNRRGAHFNARRVEHRTDARGDTASDIANFIERRVRVDLGDRNFRQDREIRKGGAAHVMVDLFTIDGEARRAIGHDA